ncbi:amino acid decarboxylase [Companilactobacillus allii]|uniref:Amino acid decarboxylase n=1 Tax=Companilactobacillus allii TaxID=1847728 RepID=A0A1P8Q5Z8_9LACO|nr:amino acid decarboxylase [Companilactobacillus allii]APX73261.1 amino acid decarboxylase [Companilactobacillus allii]USQ68077.1 amino acid decarboxylase [Companilactobacillus allii]
MPRFNITKENYTMTANVSTIGKDILIEVIGGDNPHIGTVTTLTSDTDMQTIRFPSHDGRLHKDDVLAKRIGTIIQSKLPGSCTISSGVHVNHISQKQIMVSSSMANDLGKQILSWLDSYDFDMPDPIYYTDSKNPV